MRFELLRDERVEELNSQVKIYRHKKTGARILSMENNDENKVFTIGFRTPPQDSTGVAHIMEHTVLCGSQKYPLKEPFIQLVKGSLNTFLNAMTYPDKTMYPVASQNEQDLYNLMEVYLDAVFFPLLKADHFAQEGWHYELEHIDDPLTIKGIVYNEMKGVYSNPDSLLYRYAQQYLFPDNTYSTDSGGDPKDIPNLSYEQFKQFHRLYYHPSNAWIFFYGNDDPNRRLNTIEPYLEAFEPQEADTSIPLQQKLVQPRTETIYYDCEEEGDEAKESMLLVKWMLPEQTDSVLCMALSVLSYILLSTPASPLRKTLLDSGLGEELTGGGMSSGLRQMTFSVGMKGVAEGDLEQLEKLIMETLERLAQDGFDPELLEAALNTLEFQLRENNTGSYPRGLAHILDAIGLWLHDGDPIEELAYEKTLENGKQLLAKDPQYLQRLIREHLLDNLHRCTIRLLPQIGLREREEAAELERLAQIRSEMSEEYLMKIIEQTAALKLAQETPDPPELVALLPSLKLADLDPKTKIIPIECSSFQDAEILYHDLFTNGIVYLDIGFNLRCLPQKLLPYVPLFTQALIEIGTQTEDDVKLAQRIRRKTGGIGASPMFTPKSEDPMGLAYLIMRGKSTMSQAADLLEIMRDILLTVNFDNPQLFRQMVMRSKSNYESSLLPRGHSIVNSRLHAHFDISNWISEQLGGLEQLFFVRDLAKQIDEDWPSVRQTLQQIREYALNRSQMICNVTLDQKNWARFAPSLQAWIASMPMHTQPHQDWQAAAMPEHEGLAISAQVNYVGKAANLYQLGYQYHSSVTVITKFLGTTWLWDKIRMQGGAYGGMCNFHRRTGTFAFLSYRDPNILSTLGNYDLTSRFLRELQLDPLELERTIIGTIGDIDDYMLPDAKGYSSMMRHLLEESDEFRQQIREQILSTNPTHFKQFAEALEALNQNAHVVVMGAKQSLESTNQTLSPKLTITPVLTESK